MSILINKDTKAIVQGFTGKEGTFHSQACLEYGTKILAGVTPGKGGMKHLGKPVFNTVRQAVNQTGATVSMIFVPSQFLGDAILEAAESGIKLAICITEGAPIRDMQIAKAYATQKGMKLIGPNCPGVITSQECKLGIMPGWIFKKGKVGLISKSGTLTYEGANQICAVGYGISTAIGIGGDPIIGLGYNEILPMFEEDNDTDIIVMIGEIGGDLEIQAASLIKEKITKPVIAFIAGKSAPKGKRMGHAGAIISSNSGTALEKMKVLSQAGAYVVNTPETIGQMVSKVLKNK